MDYKTVAGRARAELEVKRSRFIATAAPVASAQEAFGFIEGIKREFYDARHNVYAYLIRDAAEKFSDDGEPQGTGGKPVLGVIKQKGLVDTAVVVTRYFGGVLLGAPGLVRAYAGAASSALQKAGAASMTLCADLKIRCGYDFYGRAGRIFSTSGGCVGGRKFEADVTVDFLIPKEKAPAFIRKVTDLSGGSADVRTLGETYVDEKRLLR